MIMCYINLH